MNDVDHALENFAKKTGLDKKIIEKALLELSQEEKPRESHLAESLKALPPERIKQDEEIKKAYCVLKEIFEQEALKHPDAQNTLERMSQKTDQLLEGVDLLRAEREKLKERIKVLETELTEQRKRTQEVIEYSKQNQQELIDLFQNKKMPKSVYEVFKIIEKTNPELLTENEKTIMQIYEEQNKEEKK